MDFQHPARFTVISLKRFFYYWNGVPRPSASTSPVDFRSSAYLATSVSGIVGPRTLLAPETAGSMALPGAGTDLSDGLLLRFSPRKIPPSIEPSL